MGWPSSASVDLSSGMPGDIGGIPYRGEMAINIDRLYREKEAEAEEDPWRSS